MAVISMLVACGIVRSSAASALENLGRVSNWYLAFINDPYAVADAEMKKEEPTLVAMAISKVVTYPADGDTAEKKLLERFSKQQVSSVPKSLQKFVKQQFASWKATTTKHEKLKFKIGGSLAGADAALPWRDKNTLVIPVAAIGRSVLRAARDDGSGFTMFMWVLSHPRFATRSPSSSSDRYDLTKDCVGPTVEGLLINCGGWSFYTPKATDIQSSVTRFEQGVARHLRDVFIAGTSSH